MCCRDIHWLLRNRNVLADCLFLSNLFWTFVGSVRSTTLLSRERLWAPALALSILLDFSVCFLVQP